MLVRSVRRLSLALVAVWGVAQSAHAQMGTSPELSPFRDVEYNHEWTFFTGVMTNGGDAAGVAPRSGPAIGVKYDKHFSGPLFGYVRLTGVNSSRTALNPGKPLASRRVGDFNWPLLFADLGLEMSLTGQKAWHGIMPVTSFGLGVYSDLISGADVGGYEVGTGFVFTFGGGIRVAPAKRWQLRVEANNYLYAVNYPGSYFNAPSGGSTAILPSTASASSYRSNWTILVGASYAFLR